MNIKTLVSGLALTAAMAFAGPAFADTMVAGQAVVDADLPAVQARCNDLQTAAAPASLADANSTDKVANDTKNQANSDNGTTTTGDTTPKVDTLASATVTAMLEKLTVEDCTTAGLLTAK
ncbi:hypothetical protein [Devosia sp.]|uniref:hypothetical protein n=1 Tax=Devosia sp. TaxID=1871048 RepID=UPI0032679292